MEWLSDPQIWISLITLTVLEVVLGVDNIIFISILAGKLPPEQQGKARNLGLMVALVTRIALLCSIFLLTRLVAPLWPLADGPPKGDLALAAHAAERAHGPVEAGGGALDAGQQAALALRREAAKNAGPLLGALHWAQRRLSHEFTGKDLVLLLGGLFLLWKSVREIHHSLEGEEHGHATKGRVTMTSVILQICVIDIVFSLDSVITAVGLVKEIGVMIAAVVIAMLLMLVAAKPIGDFVNRHPTIKMLALSFLIMVGFVLVIEGCGQHVAKGYIYTAMAFAFGVEMLNLKAKNKSRPVELRPGL